MSRTVDWVIQKAFVHAQRKAVPPQTGTPKYNVLVSIVDSMQKQWALEPNIQWDSLYMLDSLAAVVSATDTFALDATIDYISEREDDMLRVVNGTQVTEFAIIKANQLYKYRYQDAVAQIGRTLKFSRAFSATSPLIGGTIQVPSFSVVNDLSSGTDIVQVDNPMWLAYASAAEFIRTDVVKGGQYGNLLDLAEQVMQKMKEANGGQQEEMVTGWAPEGANWS